MMMAVSSKIKAKSSLLNRKGISINRYVRICIFAEFLQVSRTNSPNDRRASRVSSRSRSSVCKHRGTPGHKCGHKNNVSNGASSQPLASSASTNNLDTTTNLSEMMTKNGSNGRANSIHLMENSPTAGDETPPPSWRERWQKFMMERDDYSLWLFPPDHR